MEKRIKDNVKEWKCDGCKKWFRLDEEWDSKGSKKECELIWGIKPEDDMPAVCDDCWEEIHPSKYPDLYTQVCETLDKLKDNK